MVPPPRRNNFKNILNVVFIFLIFSQSSFCSVWMMCTEKAIICRTLVSSPMFTICFYVLTEPDGWILSKIYSLQTWYRLWLSKSGITMLNLNKDDLEFVIQFPCLLGHPVCRMTALMKLNQLNCGNKNIFNVSKFLPQRSGKI